MPHIRCNNALLYYTDEGSGKDTVVFSHGLLMSSEMFRAQIEHFKSRYRCIAYDHRGQGRSEVTETGYDLEQLTQDAVAFIEALNVGAVHFVGLSMGGFIGMRLASRRPELLKSLTLMCTSADTESNRLKYSLMTLVFQLGGRKLIHKRLMKVLFGKTFLSDPGRQSEKERWSQYLLHLPTTISKSVSAVIHRSGVADELSSIELPVLILAGEEDMAIPVEKARSLHERITGSVLHIIPGSGHSITIEQPDVVNRLMEEFLNRA
jgi:pimeloyl-ACP methyl ester carboxylesterase